MTEIEDALERLHREHPDGFRLYVSGGSMEPLSVARIFEKRPELARRVTFCGVWLPGINSTDWAAFHTEARAETIFMHTGLRQSAGTGRLEILPLHYSEAFRWLSGTPIDAAFLSITPPDASGDVSTGIACDFAPALMCRPDVKLIGLANPHLPSSGSAPRFAASRFSQVISDTTLPVQVPDPDWTPSLDAIAGHIAGLIQDGDTIQAGIGSSQQIAMKAIRHHRNIRMHSGLVTDAVLEPMDLGVFDAAHRSIVTGAAIGTNKLYRRSGDPRFSFQPVSVTHAVDRIAAIPGFKAVNSALEIDLSGQINAEFVGDRQVSATGGLVDFMQGARLSDGGRSIIALLSTAKGGSVSRIVSRLTSPCVTVARSETDMIVTEYGVADLRHASGSERREALIRITHPDFREALSDAARK